MYSLDKQSEQAIANAWNNEAARSNLERWLDICEKESWGRCPDNLPLLIRLFGASWFFTRFVFFRGNEVCNYFDNPVLPDCSIETLRENLLIKNTGNTLDEKLDMLRITKSETMLQILLAYLAEQADQELTEVSLSNLAEATLWSTIQILDKESHHDIWQQIAILAMGRLAGHEMNFASDLDLIILFPEELRSESATIIQQAQRLMRYIAEVSPYGALYEIDMRLRPHGSSGTLVSSAQYFVDYHNEEREIWERQMMTRCRPVIDNQQLATESLNAIKPAIYTNMYKNNLKTEIMAMRMKVQEELGEFRDKYEIKRGAGGIMDIDFITHYLQLLHGSENKHLQTSSTRHALRNLGELGLLDITTSQELLAAYNYLKKIEGVLRMFDMKSISTFSKRVSDVNALARAMGYFDGNQEESNVEFQKNFLSVTNKVRKTFNRILDKTD